MRKKLSKKLLVIILFMVSASSFAKARFFSINIKVKEDSTLKEALYSSTKIPKNAIEDPNLLKRILRFNPHLRKKRRVKKGERIYFELPLKKALLYAKMRRKPKKYVNPETKSKYSVSYSLSRKTILDSSSSLIINSEQNALYTIGAAFSAKINDQYSFFTTGYFSKMNSADSPSASTSGTSRIDVPIEMAGKFYVQRPIYNSRFIVYGGLDLERFSTFKVTYDDKVARLQHSFAFLTIGIAKPFKIFKKNLLVKFSLAQSVWNKLDLDSESTQTFETFSGNKIAGLLIVPLFKSVGIHFYLDKHILSAESKLDMQRFGTGIHYRF
jgi:hypothetical protein